MKFRDILAQLKGAVASYAPLCLMISFAVAFGRIMTMLDVPAVLAKVIQSFCSSSVLFLFALNLVLFLMGMIMDTSPAITILAPIMLETAIGFGIDPIHLGVIIIVNLALGMVSPPIGICLFVSAPIVKTSSGELGKKVLLPMLFFIAALLMITYIPAISLALL